MWRWPFFCLVCSSLEKNGHSCQKSEKKSVPVSCVIAEERAKQFQEDLYADGGVLFCKFCEHCIDFVCVDTIILIKSQKAYLL